MMVVRMALLGWPKRGKLKEAQEAAQQTGTAALHCRTFTCQGRLVVYLEWEAETEPQARREAKERLPGLNLMRRTGLYGEAFASMELIFYYNKPRDAAHWQRKAPFQAVGTLARIRPGMLGSYAHYHQILQETTEKVRDKYGAIFALQDLLFYYREEPGEREFPSYQGTAREGVPENWAELMARHFAPWPDGTQAWKQMQGGGET